MSVIAARRYENELFFSADSIRTSGITQESTRVAGHEQGKLFQTNDLVIGSVGYIMELSFMQLFARNHKPVAANVEAVLDFMLEFYAWAKDKDNDFGRHNTYLIGMENEIFRISESYLVETINEFSAIGAGEDFALTAMYLEKNPEEAVSIANRLCIYCSDPITTFKIPITNHSNTSVQVS